MMKEKKNHSCLHLLLLLLLAQLTAAQSGEDSGSIFNEAMTIRLSVFLCAFLFLYIFYAFLRRCIERPDLYNETSGRPVIGSGGQSHRATACRLDPAIIETFPTFIYSEVKGFKIGNGALECAVCLDEFKDDRTLRLLPKCDHIFHRECIDLWFSSHSTCPVCRASLVPEPEGSAVAVVQIYNSDNERNEQLSHVSISAIDHEIRDLQPTYVINSNQISNHNSPASSMDQSPVQMMENGGQYTLRLPEDVRKQIMNGKLNHTTSC